MSECSKELSVLLRAFTIDSNLEASLIEWKVSKNNIFMFVWKYQKHRSYSSAPQPRVALPCNLKVILTASTNHHLQVKLLLRINLYLFQWYKLKYNISKFNFVTFYIYRSLSYFNDNYNISKLNYLVWQQKLQMQFFSYHLSLVPIYTVLLFFCGFA